MSGILQTFFMSTNAGLVTNNLLFHYDPGNTLSYPGSGTSLTDLSSNAYGGTLTGGVTYSSSNGGIFTFDGVNDNINLNANIAGSMYSTNFTICMFIKPAASPPTNQSFASFWNDGDATQRRLRMRVNSDGSLQMSYFANDLSTSTSIVSFGSWFFVVMQYNSGTDTSKIWQNTTERASGSEGPFLSGTGSGGNIGSYQNAFEWFKGDIGVMMGYTSNLSSTEITQNFNAFKSRYGL
jgi:hypothetical protein